MSALRHQMKKRRSRRRRRRAFMDLCLQRQRHAGAYAGLGRAVVPDAGQVGRSDVEIDGFLTIPASAAAQSFVVINALPVALSHVTVTAEGLADKPQRCQRPPGTICAGTSSGTNDPLIVGVRDRSAERRPYPTDAHGRLRHIVPRYCRAHRLENGPQRRHRPAVNDLGRHVEGHKRPFRYTGTSCAASAGTGANWLIIMKLYHNNKQRSQAFSPHMYPPIF